MNDYIYHLDEAALRLRQGFRDATVHAFEWSEAHGRLALTIQRERRDDAETFAAAIARVTTPYPRLFAAFEQEEPVEVSMPVAGESRRFRWCHADGVVYHHQVFLDLGATMLVLTATGPAALRDEIDALLHDTLAGMQLRERGTA